MPYTYVQLTIYIIVINIGIFLLNLLNNVVGFTLAMNPLLTVAEGYFWQPLSYMFMHSDPWHLAFNLLFLFFIGFDVEKRMGSIQFGIFYILSGLGAGLLSLIVYLATGSLHVFLLGASGAIYSVMVAFACFNPHAQMLVMGIIPVRAPFLVLGYAGISVIMGLGGSSGVAHFTHLFGLLIGFVWMLVRYRINLIAIIAGKE